MGLKPIVILKNNGQLVDFVEPSGSVWSHTLGAKENKCPI